MKWVAARKVLQVVISCSHFCGVNALPSKCPSVWLPISCPWARAFRQASITGQAPPWPDVM
jgi:hypothetical protein